MKSTALIVRDDARLRIEWTAEALRLRDEALDKSAAICLCRNAEENELAAKAQAALKTVLKLVESARSTAKAPILDFGRTIDDAAKKFVVELKEEEMRLAKLIGDFQALELAKARAAEAQRVKELVELERKRMEALAVAKSDDEKDRIDARFTEEASTLPVSLPARAKGQLVKEDWEFEIFDVWLLTRERPLWVKIEPRRTEIKDALARGETVPGVRGWKVTKASVRTMPPKTLEI